MSRISKHDWGTYLDPTSPEYAPTDQEIKEEEKLRGTILRELDYINRQLSHPKEDPFTGEKSRFAVTDPELIWDNIDHTRTNFLEKIKDPELKAELEGKIQVIEKQVYKQYIPFVDSQIDTFGYVNSPINKFPSGRSMSVQEVEEHFDQARYTLGCLELSEKEKMEFIFELTRLESKFKRYLGEPTLFNFEEIEESLFRDLTDFRMYHFETIQDYRKTFGSEEGERDKLKEIERLEYKSHQLQEIAARMLKEQNRDDCQKRAQGLNEFLDHLKDSVTLPRESLALEGKLKDLLQRLLAKEEVSQDEIKGFEEQLTEMKKKRSGSATGTVKHCDRLFGKIRKTLAGETIHEEDDQIMIDIGDINWAWSRL
ncbi:MAG: hypothetical protein V1695_03675, partial [Candidatus Uhrbacteria bacterium]